MAEEEVTLALVAEDEEDELGLNDPGEKAFFLEFAGTLLDHCKTALENAQAAAEAPNQGKRLRVVMKELAMRVKPPPSNEEDLLTIWSSPLVKAIGYLVVDVIFKLTGYRYTSNGSYTGKQGVEVRRWKCHNSGSPPPPWALVGYKPKTTKCRCGATFTICPKTGLRFEKEKLKHVAECKPVNHEAAAARRTPLPFGDAIKALLPELDNEALAVATAQFRADPSVKLVEVQEQIITTYVRRSYALSTRGDLPDYPPTTWIRAIINKAMDAASEGMVVDEGSVNKRMKESEIEIT